MIVTNDAERAEKLMCLRAHGSKPKYHHKVVGGNFRLDALQAAVVSAKLPYLDSWTAARQRNAERYDGLFASSGLSIADSAPLSTTGSPQIVLPKVVTDRHIFNQYVIRVPRRDQLKAALMGKKDLFIRNLVNKVLGYALGRGLTLQDSCTVDGIVAEVERNNYRAQALINAVVMSVPFRYQEKHP